MPLAKWAKQFGEVTVVVPKYEQSGKSHCVEFRKAFEAATFGLPAVALSTKSGGFGEAMEVLDEIKDFLSVTT